jgi:hypothetical protein
MYSLTVILALAALKGLETLIINFRVVMFPFGCVYNVAHVVFSFWFNCWWWFQPVQLSTDRKVRSLCVIVQRVRNNLDAVLLLAGC